VAVNVVPVGLMLNAFSTSIGVRAGLPADPGGLLAGLLFVASIATALSVVASTRCWRPDGRRRLRPSSPT
jgi:hypothetical protein